ncbi:MAG: Hsp20/alpha crystallin family protein [Treponemataceae bacterium]
MNELTSRTEDKTVIVQPSCNIFEDEGVVRLSLEMPGVSREGIEVSVEKNELVIVGKASGKDAEGTYLIRERRRGEFRKRFIIDETIDRDRIEANMSNGILSLTLNLKEAAKPRKIEIG